jgi:hypothetical protein
MSGRRRWGKAGVRLTDGQIDIADRRTAHMIAVCKQRSEENLRIARRKWAAGMVIPYRITAALDLCGLYGPEVDEACLAREPDVDMWEAGRLYPSWEQLVALARLTGFHPVYFMGPCPAPIRVEDTSMVFHLPKSERESPPPVHGFTRAALDAAAEMGVRA